MGYSTPLRHTVGPTTKGSFGETERVISSKIFVGNLDYATTDEQLRELFGEIGEVVDVHIPKDRETGRPRGFAFVRFAAEEHAAQAVEQIHGREVAGRALRLDIAEDKPRPPRPRRDFGGGGGRPGGNRGGYDSRGGPPGPPDANSGLDDRLNYDRGRYDDRNDDSRGGFEKPKRPKGSRRGLRGKKRSL
ncbi:MAG: RNA-binding protein [Polyangiales bacterium]